MSGNSSKDPWSEYEEKLVQTQARRAELRTKFEKKDEELRAVEEKLANAVQVLKDMQQVMASVVDELIESGDLPIKPQASQAASQIGPDSPFYGKSLPECAVIVIRKAGRALTEEEIVAALKVGGVQIVSKMPQMNVRRSMARRPDILQTRNRKWAVIETPIEGDKLPPKRVVNNFTTAHAENTRIGIAAAQARGVTVGRTPVITPEKETILLELRNQGLQANEISKAIGVSRTTYFNYLKEKGWSKQYSLHDAADQPEEDNLL
jgi:predicted transcriptional regulator YheO